MEAKEAAALVAVADHDEGQCRGPATEECEGGRQGLGPLERLRRRSTCSIDEAAEILGIGRSTAYAAAHDGSLPTVRLSHRLLVPTARLLAMLGVDE